MDIEIHQLYILLVLQFQIQLFQIERMSFDNTLTPNPGSLVCHEWVNAVAAPDIVSKCSSSITPRIPRV